MRTFAPPYHPEKHQQSFLSRQQKAQSRKRKRGQDSSDDEPATPIKASPEPEPTPRTASSAFHPVNRTDPFYIAGHPRELPLPLPPFPHAAPKQPSQPRIPIEEELAALNPPLYVPVKEVEDKSTSLRRRHLDNVTAILHKCMLKGDWDRAHRAWGLLIRTEISGRGIDIRRHGRWSIGAELLMRRGARPNLSQHPNELHESSIENDSPFTDEGFKLARSYYERLILQYPHTQHTHHTLNASAIYPALFNIWIYSVQDRSKRAKHTLETQRRGSVESASSTGSLRKETRKHIRDRELEDATAIATRMDELILSPPYDTDTTLLHMRAMVALWLADLHVQASKSATSDASEVSDASADSIAVTSHRPQARAERRRAREIFSKLEAQGVELEDSTRRFLENDEVED